MPMAILNKPQLMPGLQMFVDAFWRLDTCRPAGMDLGPIPWLAVDQYANSMGMAEEQRGDLWHYIRAMDVVYRRWAASKRPKPAPQAP